MLGPPSESRRFSRLALQELPLRECLSALASVSVQARDRCLLMTAVEVKVHALEQ